MKKQQLHFRFHDPNPTHVTADFLVKLFLEVDRPKAEAAIRAASQVDDDISVDRALKLDKA